MDKAQQDALKKAAGIEAAKLIENGIRHEGFSLVECVSVCPTYYGRKNKKGDAVEMLKWQRDNAVPALKARPGRNKARSPESERQCILPGLKHPRQSYCRSGRYCAPAARSR